MFGGIKDFFVKKLLEKQLKNVPPAQRDMIMNMVQKNPELFKKIAAEVENKKKNEGKDEMVATMEVMRKYQGELRNLMQ
ncbi:MAG TPA: hypothetical protein PK886_02240 [Candidatus Paceibacterota bacterium]|jgi:hypothetical protein|nr:hypothetical protein [Candidatus Paceibacterota bacterium]